MKYLYLCAATLALTISACAFASQPNMDDAYSRLQEAKASLEKAPNNKGGHKERALKLIDQAMTEVLAGKGYAGN